MDSSKITQDTTVNDLLQNPSYYGIPSFKEFCANPSLLRKSQEHNFEVFENQVGKLGKVIQKKIWWMDGVRCDSPEQAQQVMKDKGLKDDDLQVAPELENIGGQKANLHIRFKRKTHLLLPGDY